MVGVKAKSGRKSSIDKKGVYNRFSTLTIARINKISNSLGFNKTQIIEKAVQEYYNHFLYIQKIKEEGVNLQIIN